MTAQFRLGFLRRTEVKSMCTSERFDSKLKETIVCFEGIEVADAVFVMVSMF